MKKFVVSILIAVVAIISVPVPADATPRIRAKVCAKQWDNPPNWKKHQCRKQGWFYERGSYTETDGRIVQYALVVGPNGRVWIDTLGQLGNVR
jgi:hypothetical protein